MEKLFDVKKNKMQRIGLRIFTLFSVFFIIVPIICWKQPWEYMVLIFLPYDIMLLGILLYYETWSISFFSDRMCKKVFFFTTRTYYYNMIQAAYIFRGLLVIKFKDKRKFYIQSDCEQLSDAMERIERYCRIQF